MSEDREKMSIPDFIKELPEINPCEHVMTSICWKCHKPANDIVRDLQHQLQAAQQRAEQAEAREAVMRGALEEAKSIVVSYAYEHQFDKNAVVITAKTGATLQLIDKALISTPPGPVGDVECSICGQRFNSVGDSDEYEHNWRKCKGGVSK